MNLEERALEFATLAHASIDQRRKYTNENYIVHPTAVAEIVRSVPHTPEMIAAAYLHDVVEDVPGITIVDIESKFGATVGRLVWYLTDISRPEDGNRQFRKEMDRIHISKASAEAMTIKLADLIDNTLTIEKYDPDFWRVYRHEKKRLLEVLRAGDPDLWSRAAAQCV